MVRHVLDICFRNPDSPSSVAHVLRASANVGSYASPLEDTCVRTVMNVVNRILASPTESVQTKTKACFILCTRQVSPRVLIS